MRKFFIKSRWAYLIPLFYVLFCSYYSQNSYALNRIKEIKHENLQNETQIKIVLSEEMDTPLSDYQDKDGLVIRIENLVTDEPRWKVPVSKNKILKEILVLQSKPKEVKLFFHVKNPGEAIPYTITTSKSLKTIIVSLKHPLSAEIISETGKTLQKPREMEEKIRKEERIPEKTQEVPQEEKQTDLIPYEEPEAPPPPDTLSLLLRMGSALALIIGVIFLMVFVAKKFFPNALKNLERNKVLKVIAKHSLGTRKQIILIEIHGRKLLLGVTPTQINFLVEIEEETEEDLMVRNQEKQIFKNQLSDLNQTEEKVEKAQEEILSSSISSNVSSEEAQTNKEDVGLSVDGQNLTVQEALTNLNKTSGVGNDVRKTQNPIFKPNRVAEVGSHKKTLKSALDTLHEKINQIDEKETVEEKEVKT